MELNDFFEHVVPNAKDRAGVFQQLLRSVELADAIAPGAWSVTRGGGGFRLNVGPVEALVLHANAMMRLNILLNDKPVDGLVATDYQSMPEGQAAFIGSISDYLKRSEELEPEHRRFIKAALTTVDGTPVRGSPFAKFHVPQIIEYAFAQAENSCLSSDEFEAGQTVYNEGAVIEIRVNRYERNPHARAACIQHHGAVCLACGFDFEKKYGLRGKGFVHVHHLVPMSKIGSEYLVNPITDLAPLCANCHAMIHRSAPALSIEDLKTLLGGQVCGA